MKSQAAIEYLIMVGVGLLAVTLLFYYTRTYSMESLAVNQARETVNNLAQAVDHVYSLGPGSRTRVQVNIPTNVINRSISNNEILLRVSTRSGVTDVWALTRANITGTLPSGSGTFYITVTMGNQSVNLS